MKRRTMPKGGYTAMVTPFNKVGEIDWMAYKKNLQFQFESGIRGPLSVGTTGESCTLTKEEHIQVNLKTAEFVMVWREKKEYLFHLAGVGSNNVRESMEFADAIVPRGSIAGSDGLLLVDPYYNGPSSLEIRVYYYEPFAARYSNQVIVPYIIPGRTGCALSAQDLVLLSNEFKNVEAVKEATGDLERMKKTRKLTSDSFKIFSGDDDKTFLMMTDPEIAACGVISVISNVAPAAVQDMCTKLLNGDIEEAQKIKQALDPLFKLVTIKVKRNCGFFIKRQVKPVIEEFEDKYRNPVPIKTIMNVLGIPAGPCRPPLGKMSLEGINIIRETLKKVWQDKKTRWVLEPIEEFYDVKIEDRLDNDKIWKKLTYQD